MPTTINLPSGASAVMRDDSEITERGRRAFQDSIIGISDAGRAILEAQDLEKLQEYVVTDEGKADLIFFRRLNDVLTFHALISWSYELPVSADSLPDLPGNDYQALIEAASKRVRGFAGVDFSPKPDPSSPS